MIVIQVARLSGFSPIIATASLHNTDLLRSLGATHVVDRNLDHATTTAEITKLAGAPIKFVYDSVALQDTQNIAIDILAPGGYLILTLDSQLPEEKTAGKSLVKVFGNVHPENNRKTGVALYNKLTELLATGSVIVSLEYLNFMGHVRARLTFFLVQPNRVDILPGGLAGIPAGLERLKNNQVSGVKLVARPQETA